MNEAPRYSFIDIQRYLQRQMSPREMHEFEKALMDDPFLADAIEGFANSNETVSSSHLQAIGQKLQEGKNETKVVQMPGRKSTWWKAAAIILVIVISGAIFYSLVNKQPDEVPLAKQDPVETIQAPAPINNNNSIEERAPEMRPGGLQPETNMAAPKLSPTSPEVTNPPLAALKQDNFTIDTSLAINNNTATESRITITDMPPTTSAMQSGDRASVMAFSFPKQNVFKGIVLDKTGEPLPFASLRVTESHIGTIADGNGNFILKAPDSILHVKVNATGYDSAIAEIRSNSPLNKITLPEQGLSLADMVVIGYNEQAKKRIEKEKLNKSITAEPVGGWLNFEKYLKRSVDSLKAAENEFTFDENVALEFSINDKGEATNIKPDKETDKIIAEKAAQILQAGPKWQIIDKNKKVKVVISF